jgi:hypothetical protein
MQARGPLRVDHWLIDRVLALMRQTLDRIARTGSGKRN